MTPRCFRGKMDSREIILKLFELKDDGYKDFQSKLMPTVSKDRIIGVRTPLVRQLASEIWRCGGYEAFTAKLPHVYYEEDNIHAFLIEKITDYDECIRELDRFLPYVDNWATCDSMSPKVLKKHTDELYSHIIRWIEIGNTYTVRFAIKTLMNLYSRENFKREHLDLIASVIHDDYYVKMVVAWYFATLLAFQYEQTVKYLENKCLDRWVHNKAIQKAIESYRISEDRKIYLRSLKIT